MLSLGWPGEKPRRCSARLRLPNHDFNPVLSVDSSHSVSKTDAQVRAKVCRSASLFTCECAALRLASCQEAPSNAPTINSPWTPLALSALPIPAVPGFAWGVAPAHRRDQPLHARPSALPG